MFAFVGHFKQKALWKGCVLVILDQKKIYSMQEETKRDKKQETATTAATGLFCRNDPAVDTFLGTAFYTYETHNGRRLFV